MRFIKNTWNRGLLGKLVVGLVGLTGCCISSLIVAIAPTPTSTRRAESTPMALVASVPTYEATATSASATEAPIIATAQPTEPPTPEPEPTAAPTDAPPTATPEPVAPAIPAVSPVDAQANVRAGPGTGYAIIGTLVQGQSAPITGKSADNTWWQIDQTGARGWVRGDVVTASGALDAVAVAAAPPLPVVAAPVVVATDTLAPVQEIAPAIEAPPTAPVVEAIIAAPEPAANIAPSGGCDPSYPTICIPIGSGDLDCPDIPYRRFEVVGSDPHRFDGDNDGVGCEG